MSTDNKNTEPKNAPLSAAVEGDELVIRIGIDTLAHAAEHCPNFYDYPKHRGSAGPYVKVVNNLELAKDVVRALLHEQEDGSTEISTLLDEAIEWAHGDGSEAFDYDGE